MRGTLTKLVGMACVALACMGAIDPAKSAVVYSYTGNPLNQATFPPGVIGERVAATVTFNDSVAGFTGTVDGTAVLAWSIRLDGVAGTEITSATGFLNPNWPLYFVFNAGVIESWQLLGEVAPASYPEIYTTRNSPYPGISPTADYYSVSQPTTIDGIIFNTPGVWQLVNVPTPVPEPIIGGFLLAGGWLACAGMASRRRRVE